MNINSDRILIENGDWKMDKSLVMIGLILTLTATIFLYLGSRHIPWGVRTMGGESKKEVTFIKACQRETRIGLGLLFFGFLFQLIGVMTQN